MAKLDKMKFARVIAHCISNGMSAGEYEVNTLDELIDIDVPQPVVGRIDYNEVDKLMFLMQQGTQKIETIKQYRTMTGLGLKEAKDAVERHWVSKHSEPSKLSDIMGFEAKNALGD